MKFVIANAALAMFLAFSANFKFGDPVLLFVLDRKNLFIKNYLFINYIKVKKRLFYNVR